MVIFGVIGYSEQVFVNQKTEFGWTNHARPITDGEGERLSQNPVKRIGRCQVT